MGLEQKSALRMAILGTRGIPAAYGGFETFAEELATRLAGRGHAVTVFGRRFWEEGSSGRLTNFKGVSIRAAPTVRHKYFETPLSSLTASLMIGLKYDVVILCNAANSPFAWILRLKGLKLLINVDGIERLRGKWNILGRWWYRLGEICSVLFANRIVADAYTIARYYRESYGCQASVIRYGAKAEVLPPGGVMQSLGVTAKNYLLYVSRLEPE
ncbi:MAG: glycosyl transferase family 1, partial [Proteobacteria bacterium]